MDPLSMIVAAVSAGALAALKPTAEQAVKDAYTGLKALIQHKYSGKVDVAPVERAPTSNAKRESLREDLMQADAEVDSELLDSATRLLEELQRHAPESAAAVGVDLEEVKAVALRIREATASGTGVRVRKGEFTGDIEIGTVRAGSAGTGNAGPNR